MRVPSHKRLLLRMRRRRKDISLLNFEFNDEQTKRKRNFYIEICSSSSTNRRQSVRQVRDQTVIFFCICKSSSLPAGWQYVIDIDKEEGRRRRRKISNKNFLSFFLCFFFYTSSLMLFDTLARAIWSFDQWSFSFSRLFKQTAASIVFLLDRSTHNFSLWLSHILLTFLSLNLVKRTVIELSTHIEYCSIWKAKRKRNALEKKTNQIYLMSMSIIRSFSSSSSFFSFCLN